MQRCAFSEGRFRSVTFAVSLIVIEISAFMESLIGKVRAKLKFQRIERQIFHESKLRKIVLSKTVKHVEEYAFSGCWNVEIQLEKHSNVWRISSSARKDGPTEV
jgi:hypothetical protein